MTDNVQDMTADAVRREIFTLLKWQVIEYWLDTVITPRKAYKIVDEHGNTIPGSHTAYFSAEEAIQGECLWPTDDGPAYRLVIDVLDRLNAVLFHQRRVLPIRMCFLVDFDSVGYYAKDWGDNMNFVDGRDALAFSKLALLALRRLGG